MAMSAPMPAQIEDNTGGRFDWPLANKAEDLVRKHVLAFLQLNSWARQLSRRMADETGTDLFEWVDHVVVSPTEQAALEKAGLVEDPRAETHSGERVFEHRHATLPRVIVRKGQSQSPSVLALKPELIAEFIAAQGLKSEPQEEPFSRYRRVLVSQENGTQLEALERPAYRGFVSRPLHPRDLAKIVKARELWRTRPRGVGRDSEG